MVSRSVAGESCELRIGNDVTLETELHLHRGSDVGM